MKRATLLSSLLLLAAACGFKGTQTQVVERVPTTFPHEIHGGFDCADCHTGIIKSTRLGDSNLPGVAKCEECHDRTSAEDKAKFNPPRRKAREYELRFDHAAHLKRVPKGECATCHKDLPAPGQPWNTSPPMATCTACHEHKVDFAEARCSPCHVSLKRYPLKPITEFSHEGNWVKEHGRLARGSAESCATCHEQTYCAQCHATATRPARPEIFFPEKVEVDFIHRADFVSRHKIEASADPASCRKCHGSYFCDSCHKEQGLSPRSLSPRDPHPAGWSSRGSGTAFHGDAARANIVSCAGCHDQGAASICVMCHKVGSVVTNINIHPPGFKQTDKTKAMCRACHP
ncbi:MAG: cytochrome c3 family protein [Deltaproteobacteria bacterium]|nr:cytochrome c3 family protein [Deltaproteobacteria bacterium]